MLRELTEAEVTGQFFELMAEIECGGAFDPVDAGHVEWLTRRIRLHFARGAQFHGLFQDNGHAVGLISLLIETGPDGRRAHCAQLLDIGVYETHRERGYGGQLLKHAEAVSRGSGAYCMYVYTYAGNRTALGFYIRRGFVPVAMHPDVHGPHDQGDVYLRKVLL